MSETNTKKRTERGSFDEGISPEHKVTRVMASPSAEVESPATLEMDEPSLGDIHQILIEVQGTIEQLLKTSFQLSTDVAELKNSVKNNRQEVTNLKQELVKQNKYIASLEKQLTKTSKYVKEHADELKDMQANLDNLEQYSRKNSLEFHGIPDEVNMPTDQVVCKIAQAIGVEIQEDDIEISHRIGRKRGDKPVLAKFVSDKVKSKIYKARTNLKAVSVQSLFPDSSVSSVRGTTARPKGIYINENLTPYRKEMMGLAVEKRHDGKINKVWTLDGKIFIKTTPTGNPRQMFSVEDVKEL